MDIGSKIKQLRQKASMTQEQLGASLGISAQSVSKWENGVTMPDIALLPLLSSVLGVTIDEIFDLTTEQKLQRIERQMDIEDTFSDSIFYEYKNFLTEQLDTCGDRRRVLSLLARLYHHRAESDLGKVRQYARGDYDGTGGQGLSVAFAEGKRCGCMGLELLQPHGCHQLL